MVAPRRPHVVLRSTAVENSCPDFKPFGTSGQWTITVEMRCRKLHVTANGSIVTIRFCGYWTHFLATLYIMTADRASGGRVGVDNIATNAEEPVRPDVVAVVLPWHTACLSLGRTRSQREGKDGGGETGRQFRQPNSVGGGGGVTIVLLIMNTPLVWMTVRLSI